jgi:hypothetical protein
LQFSGSRASLGQFAVIVGVVFVGEALVMTLLELVHVSGSWAILVDPVLLALICAPVLHRVVVRPSPPAAERPAATAGNGPPAADRALPAGRQVIRIR